MRSLFGSILVCGMLCSAVSPGYTQAELGFNGVGGKLGLVDPENVSSVVGFGLFAALGTIAPNIHLEGNLDYWSKSEGAAGAEVSFRDLTLGGTVKYMFPSQNSQITPFVVGGLGFHFFRSKVSLGPFGSASDSETKIGIDVGGGAVYKATPAVDILAELRYRLVSDINQLCIMAGVLYSLTQ